MRQRVAVLAVAVAGMALAEPAWAIPAFARRYKVECHFCHDGYPKLNNMGQRFRERGFRMEREDPFKAADWIRSIPVVVRASANRFLVEGDGDSNFGFLKGISAGNLGTRFAYWVDDGVSAQEGEDNFTHAKPNNAWLRFEIVRGNKLYAKAGRIELDLPFTHVRNPHLFSYDIYFANTGFESDNIGDYQDGVELGGNPSGDLHWSAAVVKGRNSETAEENSDDAGRFDANVYLRVAKRVNKHRFGGFAYIGRNTLAPAPRASFDNNLLRLGLDASVWARRLNLYGAYMYGRNSDSTGTRKELSFNGGFVQADYHVRDIVVLTARLNAVSRPPGRTQQPHETFTDFFPGIQVFLFEHGKLSFEYGFFNKDQSGYGAIQAEVAF